MTECPTQAILERFITEDLSATDRAACEEHLRQCATCRKALQRLQAEDERILADLRALGSSGEASDDSHASQPLPDPPEADGSESASQSRAREEADVTEQSRARKEAVNAPTPDAPSAVPIEIEGYDLQAEIYRGGQGIVYRGVQRHTNRIVAVKVLREGPLASDAAQRRFAREIELAAQLKHPSIVTVFHSGRTRDGLLYCVMDYVPGTPLDEHVRSRNLALEQTLALLAEIGDAVNYAHQRGIIHRDLKPSNILVTDQGEPRVLDFGLAKQLLAPRDALASLTGEVFGTLPYMAPEQTTGNPDDVDIRADVYALGVIIYRLLTGRFPYKVEGPLAEVIHNITDTPPEPPSRVLAAVAAGAEHAGPEGGPQWAVNSEVEAIVLKALAKEKPLRYQSALELTRDLRAYLDGEPISAKRSSTWYVLRKTIRRHRLRFATAAAVLLLVIGSSIALAIMYREQSRLLAESDRRFQQVRELANTFIFDVNDRIESLPGATEARQFIVQQGLEYLDALAAESSDNPDIMHDVAAAYSKIADVEGSTTASNLGQPLEALRHYQRAQEIEQALADSDPTVSKYRVRLAIFSSKLAKIQMELQQSEAGLKNYEVALNLARQFAKERSDEPQVRGVFLINLQRTGSTLTSMREMDRAKPVWDETVAETEKALAEFPDDVGLRHIAANNYMALAQFHHALKDETRTLAAYQRCVEIAERATEIAPSNITYQRTVASCTEAIADRTSDAAQADAMLERSLKIRQALADADPRDVRSRADLARTYGTRGRLLAERSEWDAALASYQRAVDLAQEVLQINPHDLSAKSSLAGNLTNMGLAHGRLGNADSAVALYDSALTVRAEMAEADPHDAFSKREHARLLCILYEQLSGMGDNAASSIEQRLTNLRRARECLQQAIEARDALLAAGFADDSDDWLPSDDAMKQCDDRIRELAAQSEAASSNRPNEAD